MYIYLHRKIYIYNNINTYTYIYIHIHSIYIYINKHTIIKKHIDASSLHTPNPRISIKIQVPSRDPAGGTLQLHGSSHCYPNKTIP